MQLVTPRKSCAEIQHCSGRCNDTLFVFIYFLKIFLLFSLRFNFGVVDFPRSSLIQPTPLHPAGI